MNSDAIDRAVKALIAAKRTHRPISALPEGAWPTTHDDAYDIQAAYAAQCGVGKLGYKIGSASAQSQAFTGTDRPFLARLYEGTVFQSPACIPRGLLFGTAAEAELGFRMANDLPPKPGGYSRHEVKDHIASVHPIVEMCDHRFIDWRAVDLFQLIADNGFYGALVVGAPIDGWDKLDLAEAYAAITVGGTERAAGKCGPVLGDPVGGVAWVATELSRQGRTLEAGSMIAIGTWTGLHVVGLGETVEADFGPLGRVEIAFEQ